MKLSPILWAICPMVCFWVILLSHRWVPSHDTLGSLFWYKLLLTHYLDTGRLPLWINELAWGQNTALSTILIHSPAHLLLIPLIKLFPTMNSTTLFFLGMFINEAILLGGAYLLGSQVFEEKRTVAFVALILSGTVGWTIQRYWNFQLFYHLPLALFFIHRGIQRSRLDQLILGFAIAVLFSLVGNLIYLAPLLLIICAFYALLMLFHSGRPRFQGQYTRRTGLLLLLTILCTSLPIAIVITSDPVGLTAPNRGTDGAANYDTYLNYAQDRDLASVRNLVDGLDLGFDPSRGAETRRNDGNVSTYAGVFLLAFVILGLIFSTSQLLPHFALLVVVSFSLFLGASSLAAPMLYLVPGMSFFRHFGLTLPLCRLFLIFLSGFGFEVLTRQRSPRVSFTFIALLLTSGVIQTVLLRSGDRSEVDFAISRYGTYLFCLGIAAIAVLRRDWSDSRDQNGALAAIILGLTLIDVTGYRSAFIHHTLNPATNRMWNELTPGPIHFNERRSLRLPEGSSFKDWMPIFVKWPGARNAIATAAMGLDLCHPFSRLDAISPDAVGIYQAYYRSYLPTTLPPGIFNAIGCDRERFRFYPRATLFSSEQMQFDATTRFRGRDALPSVAVEPELLVGTAFQRGQELVDGTPLRTAHDITDFHWDQVTVQLQQPSRGMWLSYSNSFSPAWKATIDGQPAPLLKMNIAFQGVWLPPGTSKVVFQYDSSLSQIYFALLWVLIGITLVCGSFAVAGDSAEERKASHRFEGAVPLVESLNS